uniref:uncharacterized protein LOC120821237 n=1 Tax=Gasterosteus aculeatus aculeatus TaxID=481459 RepID=UPI001A991272
MGRALFGVLGLFLLNILLYCGHAQVTNRAVVTLQHDWPEIYSGETITLTCGIEEGGGSEWEYEWRTPGYYTPPNPRGSMRTSSVTGDYSCKGRLKDGASTTKWSDAFTVKTSAEKPKAQLRKDSPVAGSVTLTCSVESSSSSSSSPSSGWKYFWYRDEKTSEPLKTGDDVLLQSGSISPSGRGVYWCRGGRGDPVYYTEYSHPVATNRAVVTLQHDLPEIYSGETITLTCGIEGGGGSEWEYEWRTPDYYTPPNPRGSMITSSVRGDYSCKGRLKDGGSTTEWSDAFTVKTSAKPKAQLRKDSPVAGRVTLTCSVGSSSSSPSSSSSSSGWKYFWYKDEKTSEPLKTGDDVLLQRGSISPSGGGVYWCRGGRGGRGAPVYYTEYSHPVATNRAVVKPNWPEIYSGETITLTCGIEEGGGSEWEYEWRTPDYYTPPHPRGSMMTSSVRGDYSCKGRLKDGGSTTEWSDAFTVKTSAAKPKAQLSKDSPVAGRVTLTCSVGSSSSSSSSSGWKYFWYKDEKTSEPLKTGDDVLLQSGSISPSGGGVYWCRGGRGDPVYYTEYSHPVVTNRAVVTLQHDLPEIYSGETITLTCGIEEGGGSEWEYEWRTPDYYTPPNPRGSMMTSSVRGDYSCKGRLKDGGSTTEWSDAFTVKTSEKPKAQLRKDSPVAGSVTLTCSVGSSSSSRSSSSSSGWKYFWYKDKKTSEPLKTGDDVLLQSGSISPSGGGVYWCRGGRGDPVYYTEYSHPVVTNRAVVKPNWPEIYSGETITLTCGIEEGGGSEWEYEWRTPDYYTPPNPRGSMMTSSVRGDYSCKGRLKDGGSTTEWSDAFTVKTSEKPKAQLSKDSPVGGRVTLTCSVGSSSSSSSPSSSSSSGWKFFWYRDETTSKPLKPGDDVLLQGGSISPSAGGVYWCRGGRGGRGGRGDPVYYTEYSHPVATNRAVVKPNWPEIYSGETITLTCGIEEGGGSEWEYEWRTPDYYTPRHPRGSVITSSVRGDYSCKGRLKDGGSTTEWSDAFTVKTSAKPKAQLSKDSVEGRVTLTCSVGSSSSSSPSSGWKYFWYKHKKYSAPLKTRADVLLQSGSISPSGGGVYWCRGGRGDPVYYTEYSHPVDVPQPVLTVSPSWTSPGDSVTLTCSVEPPSAGWRFFWYQAVPELSLNYTYELLAGNTTGTEQDSYILHGQTHTAGYVCRAGRGDPVFYTLYSDVKFVWSGGVNPAASLTVSPHRLQHFSTESLSLSCEGNSTEWRVMKADESGFMSSCSYWGQMTGSTCNTTRASSGVYWCESATQSSNAANITTHSGDVILVSPVHPVTEGHSVTLGCMLRTKELLDNVDFYKNDQLLPNGVGGELFISAVTKSDEGFYKCRGRKSPPGLETLTSAESWLSVEHPEEAASSSVFLLLLVVGLASGILLIILLLLILRRYRKSKASSLSRSQRTNQSPAT